MNEAKTNGFEGVLLCGLMFFTGDDIFMSGTTYDLVPSFYSSSLLGVDSASSLILSNNTSLLYNRSNSSFESSDLSSEEFLNNT